MIASVEAEGPDVDAVVEAVGEDKYRCETPASASYLATLNRVDRTLCTPDPLNDRDADGRVADATGACAPRQP